MTVTTTYRDDVACVPRTGTLYDVIDIILDRGMVIDVFLRVSLVGIEILKIDVRVVIASVDTYLRFAEACNRIDLEADTRSRTVPELFGGGGAVSGLGRKGLSKAAKGAGHAAKEALVGEDDDEDEHHTEEEPVPAGAGRSKKHGGGKARRHRGEED
ncbi:gas vesicle protein GvpJ [Streptomyces sp. NBC_01803]|uniref:gas vesicle protein GvpJ n=1 Tax=Streptomyces sp. NBC_01803 TaxID=2975946 RepID=UPI002DD8A94E|nr:gas vesicle protein GvpJ [Streptomyces sp. NBC_01803]WSA44165.1 gas vesicle structural protein GvpA [Streptomyces sp. NBC_01803]